MSIILFHNSCIMFNNLPITTEANIYSIIRATPHSQVPLAKIYARASLRKTISINVATFHSPHKFIMVNVDLYLANIYHITQDIFMYPLICTFSFSFDCSSIKISLYCFLSKENKLACKIMIPNLIHIISTNGHVKLTGLQEGVNSLTWP